MMNKEFDETTPQDSEAAQTTLSSQSIGTDALAHLNSLRKKRDEFRKEAAAEKEASFVDSSRSDPALEGTGSAGSTSMPLPRRIAQALLDGISDPTKGLLGGRGDSSEKDPDTDSAPAPDSRSASPGVTMIGGCWVVGDPTGVKVEMINGCRVITCGRGGDGR